MTSPGCGSLLTAGMADFQWTLPSVVLLFWHAGNILSFAFSKYSSSINGKKKYLQLLFFSEVPTLVWSFVRAAFRQTAGVSISDETLKICLSWHPPCLSGLAFPLQACYTTSRAVWNVRPHASPAFQPRPSDPFCCLLEPVQSVSTPLVWCKGGWWWDGERVYSDSDIKLVHVVRMHTSRPLSRTKIKLSHYARL